MNPYLRDDLIQDAKDREADAMIAKEEAIADRASDILQCDGEIYEAVTDDDDTDAGRSFWESVRDLMEHGVETDDVQFLEAARGIYDAVIALADQKAELEVGNASE